MLGALGGLLAVIWKSRCHCRMNLCYICQCERKPPPDSVVDSSEEEIVPEPEPEPDEGGVAHPSTLRVTTRRVTIERRACARRLRHVRHGVAVLPLQPLHQCASVPKCIVHEVGGCV